MDARDKKLAILHQLSQETAYISLQELLHKMGKGYLERSMRRWLMEMVKEGIVEKEGNKRSTKYRILKYTCNVKTKNDTSSCFGSQSFDVIKRVRRSVYERHPTTYAAEWFDIYQPNESFYLSADTRLRLHQAGNRCKREDPAGTYAHQIFNRLLIDLSYNSSRLEGNTYSLLDTERLILEGTGAEGKLDEEKIMILNHKQAIRYLVNTAPRLSINTQTICTVHYLLADGLIESCYAGKIRDHHVRISGSTYIPFEGFKKLQFQLERITEKATLIKDPYEQSLFLLVHITYLQAFADINKRTARLSANIPLIVNNLVPLSFNDVERTDYMSAIIAIYELQDVRPLIDLYLFSYLRTCVNYEMTVKAISFDEIRVRYRQQRRALIRHVILHHLVGTVLDHYVRAQIIALVAEQDRAAFFEDLLEDFKEMDHSRIVGLGITPDQLDAWLTTYQQHPLSKSTFPPDIPFLDL